MESGCGLVINSVDLDLCEATTKLVSTPNMALDRDPYKRHRPLKRDPCWRAGVIFEQLCRSLNGSSRKKYAGDPTWRKIL